MRRNLGPEGLLMFDVNALSAYRTFFAEKWVVERGGRRLVWKGAHPPMPSRARSPKRASRWSRSTARAAVDPAEMHRQRHFPEAEVLATLERAGLECLDVYGHGYDAVPKQPLDEAEHTKAIYIARAARSR